ncbi:glycosyl hydrolase family 8 [Arthrobacter sp. RIT-PI-e]|uniref:glycosyl hydrolase family 8 n=1 Tax=Arthrobacter sp. RIT-PI-e TaxID=1681197 RepID=UPI00067629A4|nr:glycosyl hydrolase family 8 [Arthrobacter sp. RIT-PI-e]
MRSGRTPRWLVLSIVLAAAVVVLLALWATGILRPGAGPEGTAEEPAPPPTEETTSPQEASADFLDTWVDDDGRVVRRDQGNDTVSEGQAYGLLIAVGADDEERFSTIWDWTRTNLVREDGLLAWRWQDGAVVDDEPASDADLDAARALVLAGERFDRPEFTDAGLALADVVLDELTASTPLGRIMLPGLWAQGGPDYFYNPSYASPAAFAQLGAASGDPRWEELEEGATAVGAALLAASPLPPDWAQITADGGTNAMPGAAGTGDDVRYSYDAARLPLRYAESCRGEDRDLAAAVLAPLTRQEDLPAALDLGGTAVNPDEHPLGYLARAAARTADGDRRAADDDVRLAVSLDEQFPTYYGAAWITLGRLMLETDDLGGCSPSAA